MRGGSVPGDDELLRLVSRIHEAPRTVYIHCAEGHGRTGLVASAYLISIGEAKESEEALRRVRERRPKVTLSSAQRAQLKRMEASLRPGAL